MKKKEEEEDNYIRLYIYNGVRKGIYEEGFTGKGRFIWYALKFIIENTYAWAWQIISSPEKQVLSQ